MTTYISKYPVVQSLDYVKATSYVSGGEEPYIATDPANTLIGPSAGHCWMTDAVTTNQRFHIDLGSAFVVKRIYYENHHSGGDNPTMGAKTFTFWGSNTAGAFAELTYGTNTNWTQLTIDDSTFDEHVNADQVDPKYIGVTNSVAYRYYAFKFDDNWGSEGVMGVRRLELQVESEYILNTFKQKFIYF